MILSIEQHSLEKNNQILSQRGADKSFKMSTDTRDISEDCWFLPIVGEKFDGHDFIKDIIQNCRGVVFDPNRIDSKYIKNNFKNYIEVNDTTLFLQQAANLHIKWWKNKGGLVIGLTGSNGKTTNKEFISLTLEKIYPGKVFATKGNLNNHIGVPFTCLSLTENHKFAVVEMGTNHFGEIEILCRIAEPDTGYITNVGEAHLEFLKDKQGVLQEKSALYRFITQNSKSQFKFLINGEDEYLKTLSLVEGVQTSLGLIKPSTKEVEISFEGDIKIKNQKVFGEINFYNLGLSTLFLLNLFKDQKNKIIEAACSVIPPDNNRSTWKDWNAKSVFLDAYNANPSSMSASLESFFAFIKDENIEMQNVVFVIGDMNELGDRTEEAHGEIAELINKNYSSDAPNIICVGRYGKYYQKKLKNQSHLFSDVKELRSSFASLTANATHIFVKGSRSVQLETLFS